MALLVGCWVALAPAQDTREAQKKLEQVRGELRSVAQERRRIESERGQAARQLREADEKVSRAARALSETEAAIAREQQELARLQGERDRMQQGLAQQRQQLAGLLRGAYRLGNHAPLKLLLSQDTVADANRTLAYHRYLQRERTSRIATLAGELETLASLEQQVTQRRDELQRARDAHRQQASTLERDRRERERLMAELDQRYRDRAEREQALGRDAQSLETLLRNLRQAAAKAERERRAAAAAAARAAAAKPPAGTERPRAGKVPPRVTASAPPPRVGGLGWPVSGNLLSRYGGRLPDGRASSGVLIGAPAGTPVTAVADGTVVFSDWMTGYGMILIIDHGNGYMSLYAHNDALLRDAGARIKRGEAVARVGNSGGQGVPALYFELRRNGQPVDPSSWLQRR
ncbi:peptidoglycan DD-metalloendopeptidase family protein [Stenotrophomonas sp. Marseille-Q4652]|uniref:murein hydrolase activator EnvC family protein n=1 Tax=Stenotrophomonas sp. Marseille-Q4652 TaxID=2866595 RepID=UPI001CE47B55|nr:peptidoglycan DD-metalloendopeptidase family protein [Stenotrophomonas sp. Marseille-Q4652]